MLEKILAFTLPALVSTVTLAVDDSLEPCINGEVSRSGSFPAQSMEDRIYVYLDWQTKDPFSLFRIASRKDETA